LITSSALFLLFFVLNDNNSISKKDVEVKFDNS